MIKRSGCHTGGQCIAMAQWEKYLKKIYFDPVHPGGFASADKLHKAVKREGKYNINLAKIKQWLASIDVYTMNKPVVRRNDRRRTRNKIPVQAPYELWDGDLIDLRSDAKFNDGYAYVLVVIDVFRRFLWTRPLKSKAMSEVKNAFASILQKTDQTVKRFRTDGGSEFTGKVMTDFYKLKNIQHYVAHNESKATFAKRVIQTLKRMMFRYMINKNELRWIDVLSKFTQNYNATYHTAINMAPE